MELRIEKLIKELTIEQAKALIIALIELDITDITIPELIYIIIGQYKLKLEGN